MTELNASDVEGMMLYAMVEFTSQPPLRQFVFANWHDQDGASLEITAEEFWVVENRDRLDDLIKQVSGVKGSSEGQESEG